MSSYIEDLFSLKGQVAVVSGGTGELCGAMAEGLAGAGAFVYLLGRSEGKAKARPQIGSRLNPFWKPLCPSKGKWI